VPILARQAHSATADRADNVRNCEDARSAIFSQLELGDYLREDVVGCVEIVP
jgi:hypothetical protein